MHVTEFLTIQTRKCSWFAHRWMETSPTPDQDIPFETWMVMWREWERQGCPTPKGQSAEHAAVVKKGNVWTKK